MIKGIRNKAEKDQNTIVQNKKEDKRKKNGLVLGVLAFLVSLAIIIAVVGGFFCLIIHNNFNKFADKYRKQIQAIPVIRGALAEPPDPDDPELFTESQLREKYKVLIDLRDHQRKQLEQANAEIQELKKVEEQLNKMLEERQTIIDQRAQLVEDRKKYEEDKQQLDRLIAEGNKEGFKEYFEKIDKKTAEILYSEILKEQKVDENMKEFVRVYEAMDSTAAARIFEQLGDSKIDLVTGALKNMKKETSAEILEEMTPAFASKVTEKLSELYNSK
jgi:flagellar motility protein MotE (MotC chaperone)